MISTIIDAVKPVEPTPSDWARYTELRTKTKPTAKEVAEFRDLIAFLGVSPNESELHTFVLAEAERLEAFIRDESEILAADNKARDEEIVERERLEKLVEDTIRDLRRNTFPAAKARLETNQKREELLANKNCLQTIYERWGGLFQLPIDQKHFYGGIYSPELMAEMTRLGVSIFG